MIAQRRIREAKVDEGTWRHWLNQRVLGSVTPMLAACTRLVVIAPHPDDEVLMAGGLICRALELGKALLVIGATDGAASHGPLDRCAAIALARQRALEREQGLQWLGAGPQHICCLNFSDGQLAQVQDHLADRLATLFRAGDLVVCTWRFDGHPDHEACGRATLDASRRHHGIQLLEAPVWMWHWACPEQPDIAWQKLVRYRLDARALQRKQHAIASHVSQHQARGEQGPVLDVAILSRLSRRYETFFVEYGLA